MKGISAEKWDKTRKLATLLFKNTILDIFGIYSKAKMKTRAVNVVKATGQMKSLFLWLSIKIQRSYNNLLKATTKFSKVVNYNVNIENIFPISC